MIASIAAGRRLLPIALALVTFALACGGGDSSLPRNPYPVDAAKVGPALRLGTAGASFRPPLGLTVGSEALLGQARSALMAKPDKDRDPYFVVPVCILHGTDGFPRAIVSTFEGSPAAGAERAWLDSYVAAAKSRAPGATAKQAMFQIGGKRALELILEGSGNVNHRIVVPNRSGKLLQFDFIYSQAEYASAKPAVLSSIGSIAFD